VVAHLRAIYGLDQPLLLRYWHWLIAALGGDFGFSRSHAQPALQVLAPALVEASKLMLSAFTLSVVLALSLGIMAALRPGGAVDGVISLAAFAGISVPVSGSHWCLSWYSRSNCIGCRQAAPRHWASTVQSINCGTWSCRW
jgi:peptide/nickel transport system permease protein